MNLLNLLEIIIAILILSFVIFWNFKYKFFKSKTNILVTFGPIMIIFGAYLYIKNGLIIDYGTEKEVSDNYAFEVLFLGGTNIIVGIILSFLSIIRYFIRKSNRFKHNVINK